MKFTHTHARLARKYHDRHYCWIRGSSVSHTGPRNTDRICDYLYNSYQICASESETRLWIANTEANCDVVRAPRRISGFRVRESDDRIAAGTPRSTNSDCRTTIRRDGSGVRIRNRLQSVGSVSVGKRLPVVALLYEIVDTVEQRSRSRGYEGTAPTVPDTSVRCVWIRIGAANLLVRIRWWRWLCRHLQRSVYRR